MGSPILRGMDDQSPQKVALVIKTQSSPPLLSITHTPQTLRTENPARICVAGSGAIGGTLAVRLAMAGHDVSVIARGANLAAIRKAGLQLVDDTGTAQTHMTAEVKAADNAAFGVQDIVFLSAKAHSLRDMLPVLAPLIGEKTVIVPTLNGLPWWYFQGEGGRFEGNAVHAVDPDGALTRGLPWRQIVGCVVYITARVAEPGVVVTSNTNRVILGELSDEPGRGPNGEPGRLSALRSHLEHAGVKAEITDRIREAVWVKLMANLATNPLSVITGATLGDMHGDDGLCQIIRAVMRETLQVAALYGIRPQVDIDQLMDVARRLGQFKTSMLQDFEKRQPLELAAIGEAVVELASRYDMQIPAIRQVLSLARFRSLQNLAS